MLRRLEEFNELSPVASPTPASCEARAEACPPAPPISVSPYFRWQPIVGWLIAAAVTPVVLPIIGLLAILVRLTSRGPGFYGQVRVGKGGRHFRVWKLRTMRADAEAQTGPVWTEENDPRITPLGRLLRKLHLDELPQLFNVLAGQMTLIGPRPERPEFTQSLARLVPGYLDRIQVLPGITGLSQINLPPDTDLDSVRRKLVLDRQYIESADLWLDLRIMLCTGLKMLGLPGLTVAKYMGLLRTCRIPAWMQAGADSVVVPATYGRAVQQLESVPLDRVNGHAGNGSGKRRKTDVEARTAHAVSRNKGRRPRAIRSNGRKPR
ncbi:sugar transferase [Thermopirellula anaerolimosa]